MERDMQPRRRLHAIVPANRRAHDWNRFKGFFIAVVDVVALSLFCSSQTRTHAYVSGRAFGSGQNTQNIIFRKSKWKNNRFSVFNGMAQWLRTKALAVRDFRQRRRFTFLSHRCTPTHTDSIVAIWWLEIYNNTLPYINRTWILHFDTFLMRVFVCMQRKCDWKSRCSLSPPSPANTCIYIYVFFHISIFCSCASSNWIVSRICPCHFVICINRNTRMSASPNVDLRQSKCQTSRTERK